jgi:hypothetical protein
MLDIAQQVVHKDSLAVEYYRLKNKPTPDTPLSQPHFTFVETKQ